jgi:dTDP-4-amino-4,6-dideoxygalactose transaminase
MQSVIGRIQLKRMPDWTKKRAENANAIINALIDFDCIRVPQTAHDKKNAYYKLYAYVDEEKLSKGWSRDQIIYEINAKGIPCMQGSCSEIYLEKAFNGTGWRPEHSLPVAKELGETSLMFLVHPTLSSENIADTVSAIREVLFAATL